MQHRKLVQQVMQYKIATRASRKLVRRCQHWWPQATQVFDQWEKQSKLASWNKMELAITESC